MLCVKSQRQGRAEGDGPKATEPNLQFQAVFCENLRFYLQFPAPSNRWESAKVSHKRVFALLKPEIRGWKMAQMLQKTSVRAPGVNTLLCDTFALAD